MELFQSILLMEIALFLIFINAKLADIIELMQ